MWKWFYKLAGLERGIDSHPIGSKACAAGPAISASLPDTKRALQGGPDCQIFTVSDLLDWFISLVVSGAGFSSEQSYDYFTQAAQALGVERRLVATFNLGDMSQLTEQELEMLEQALFNQGFVDYVVAKLAEQHRYKKPKWVQTQVPSSFGGHRASRTRSVRVMIPVELYLSEARRSHGRCGGLQK